VAARSSEQFPAAKHKLDGVGLVLLAYWPSRKAQVIDRVPDKFR